MTRIHDRRLTGEKIYTGKNKWDFARDHFEYPHDNDNDSESHGPQIEPDDSDTDWRNYTTPEELRPRIYQYARLCICEDLLGWEEYERLYAEKPPKRER